MNGLDFPFFRRVGVLTEGDMGDRELRVFFIVVVLLLLLHIPHTL